jgi:hypothetical protein
MAKVNDHRMNRVAHRCPSKIKTTPSANSLAPPPDRSQCLSESLSR